MRRTTNVTVVVGMVVALAGAPMRGWSEQPTAAEPNVAVKPSGEEEAGVSAVALLYQAGELVQYGRESESALAMLTAAQMLRRVRTREDRERFGSRQSQALGEGESVDEGAKGETPAPTLDSKAILEEAKAWAGEDPHLLALIEAELARPAPGGTLGLVGGPGIASDRAAARSFVSYMLSFHGGEVAEIGVIGDGDTDLDLYVYDENGNEVVSDTDWTDTCLVRWQPRWTGLFLIKVVNHGLVYNQYVLMTN